MDPITLNIVYLFLGVIAFCFLMEAFNNKTFGFVNWLTLGKKKKLQKITWTKKECVVLVLSFLVTVPGVIFLEGLLFG